jgi:hypothetical protein
MTLLTHALRYIGRRARLLRDLERSLLTSLPARGQTPRLCTVRTCYRQL